MNYTYLHYQIGLTLLCGIGPIKAKDLIRSVDKLDDIFTLSDIDLHKQTGLKQKFIREMKRPEALRKSEDVVDHLMKHGISAVFYTDDTYPRRLRECIDAPLVLYIKGHINLNATRLVSIVGTRSATPYGWQLTRELIQSFQDQDIIVVSGLALGIDTYVHKFCLEFNVPTIGVLGHGFDRIYPAKNRNLAKEMLNTGGLITEFIPGTKPDRENFPKRNRIVAGLTDATIVVESKLKGGSLITAHLANDYNRDVFAYPGRINEDTSQGCNQLIAGQKAHLMQTSSDLFRLMCWEKDEASNKPIQASIFPDLSTIQKSIVDLLSRAKGMQIDILSAKSKLPISRLNQELFHLEMEGVIKSVPGNCYLLV